MTIEELKHSGLIVLECLSGSKAYNLDTPHSDTDIKGVFVLPKEDFYSGNYIPQVADENNDVVYYELGRYVELLSKNNPNIMELLATPEAKTFVRHPMMNHLKVADFLSKKCKDTFGGYAFTQIRKAKGLNKKIANPIAKERKQITAFCYVFNGQGTLPLHHWLTKNDYDQAHIGLVELPNVNNTFGLYYDEKAGYKGVLKKEGSTNLLLSSVSKEAKPLTYLYFNQTGFTKYCNDYKKYWEWVNRRNEQRYLDNVEHGKNYDSKNMMHTFRLLDMALEILTTHQINVERPNREELLAIRKGNFTYEELIEQAAKKMEAINQAYTTCNLPDEPNHDNINKVLIRLRTYFYQNNKQN